MAASILRDREDVIEEIRYVTRDDLFGLNTTFHSAIMLLVYFIIISLVLYVLLITIVICGRIWHYLYNLSRITRGVKAKTNLYMIVENIQEVRRLQVTRIKTESEQKLFNQIWNELHDKYQPNQEQKVEIFFSNDFNNKNMSQDVKS
ncbi:Anaphase-promoting complex subunit [Dirofilaria immitis]